MIQAINRLSIRARITVGTLLLAILFFGGVAAVVRHQVEGILRDALFEVLTSDAAPFETAIQQEPDEAMDNPGEGQLVAVIDPTGKTQTSSLPRAVTARLSSIDLGSEEPQELSTTENTYLVAVESVENRAGDWKIITARNQDASHLVLADLTTGLITGLGALTLLFGAVSWLLTGAALRPVIQLRRSADAIVAAGSDELLPVGPAKDDIADLAATLNQLIDDLRASAARERQMVSDASHELRTPLAVLHARLELLRTGEPASLDADITAAERATARLTRIVESLLELSRLDAGRHESGASIGALLEEAGEAIDRARLRAMSDAVEIDMTVSNDLELDLSTSTGMPQLLFGRVLDNLVSNALRAVSGNGRIAVSISQHGTDLTTTVEDSGPGMLPDFIPHAFDRFSQQDDSRGAPEGSGLGLAIVAAAANAAGGTVTISNLPGAGLVVTLVVPTQREGPRPD